LWVDDAVVFSLVGAASYALASVLQHHAAVRQPEELAMRTGLLVRLARQPQWMLGNVLDGVGFVFQFLALRTGSLELVEPLLVVSLLFAVPIGAVIGRRRVSAVECVAALVVGAGLALFLVVARPGPGMPDASVAGWTILGAVTASVVLGAVALGWGSPRRKAVLWAVGAGVAFGYVAAVTEFCGHLLRRGWLHMLSSWAPYALIVAGLTAVLLTSSAFQAGLLRLSLPTMSVVQPLAAIAIGQFLFGEHISSHGSAGVWEVLGLAIMTVGVFALAGPETADIA
jgi:drug/metabolite transporter (DMT)-like permease